MKRMAIALLVFSALLTSGCSWFRLSLYSSVDPSAVADQWLGKWIGPEGTYLLLSRPEKDKNLYLLEIQSLDHRDTYQGKAVEKGIEFTREGRKELLHSGSGKDTGMKWLLDKKDCLVIRTGEGFCRN